MSGLNPLGLGLRHLREAGPSATEHIVLQRPLHRVLAFTRRSIHDVVNDPIAKNEVRGYYKLYKQIERSSEIRDLERQWNATA